MTISRLAIIIILAFCASPVAWGTEVSLTRRSGCLSQALDSIVNETVATQPSRQWTPSKSHIPNFHELKTQPSVEFRGGIGKRNSGDYAAYVSVVEAKKAPKVSFPLEDLYRPMAAPRSPSLIENYSLLPSTLTMDGFFVPGSDNFLPAYVEFSKASDLQRIVKVIGRENMEHIKPLDEPGSTSNVYVFEKGQQGSANNLEVIKVRKQKPFSEQLSDLTDAEAEDLAVKCFWRDLVLYGLAKDLTVGALYQGRQFIRVAKIFSSAAEHRLGIIRQEYIKGPKVEKIQAALNCFRGRASCSGEALAKHTQVLKEAGLWEGEFPVGLKEMQDMIYALAKFYQDTHHQVIEYSIKHDLVILRNVVESGGVKKPADVGFDFLHGLNVIWDPVARQFVLIDL